MYRNGFLAAALIGLCTSSDAADEGVNVGSARFPSGMTSTIGGKPVKMVLTGAAMRTKWSLNVYAIGSYIQEGAPCRDAGALSAAVVPKQLHLVFEREVAAETLSQSFRDSIGMNHPGPEFAIELAALTRYFESRPVKRGDHLWLTFVPGVGLNCQVVGRPGTLIRNVAFAQAAWEVYLGQKNLGVAIQSGLTSRL